MKKPIVKALRIIMPIAAVISIIIFPPWSIVWTWMQPLPDTVAEEVAGAIDHKLEGVIVYVDQAGREPELYAAGWKDRELKTPAQPDALFRIASISKLYISAAVVKLVHADTLSLDKTLADYLPELEQQIENAERITLPMMIQHRSGIPNFTDSPKMEWGKTYENPDDHLALILGEPALFEPNARYKYSNSNYLLLGKIMDRKLGYSHHEYIRRKIFEPLDLSNTFNLFSEIEDTERLSNGYIIGYDGNDVIELDHITPGGNMVATAEDVGKFLRALIDGKLFTEEEQESYSSVYHYEHTGLLPGYQSWAGYSPETDAIVVQFVNTSGGYSWEISSIINNRIFKIIEKRSL